MSSSSEQSLLASEPISITTTLRPEYGTVVGVVTDVTTAEKKSDTREEVCVNVAAEGVNDSDCAVSSNDSTTPFLAHVAEHYDETRCKSWIGTLTGGLVPHGGMTATTFNFVAATIGAGVLGLPSAMQSSGILVGTFLLLLVCACTIFSIKLLVSLFDRTGLHTYEEMAKAFIHPRFGDKIAALLFIAFCWGTTVVYVVAMSDILSKIAEVSWFPTVFTGTGGNRIITSMYWAVVFLPLSLCKEVNTLRYVSLAGIFATLFLVVAIVVHDAGSELPALAAPAPLVAFNLPMVGALPVFIFSYCCQVNAFEIYTELKPRTVKRLTSCVAMAMGLCTIIYTVAGITGALNFGSTVHGNILNNYTTTGPVYLLIAYIGVAINLASSYPLCIYPTRDAIVQLMGYPSAYATPTHIRMALCAALALLSLVAGLFAPGIQVLFGLLGGICGSSIGFIFPALFTLRSSGYSRASAGTVEWLCVWLLLIIGVFACLLGTSISIMQTVQNPSG